MDKSKLGLIHIYSGGGKGKTTASVGLAIRAAGRGLNVWFVQFLKSGKTGELEMMEKLGIHTLSGQPTGKFTIQMSEEEFAESREFNTNRLREVIQAAESGEIDLLVMDETMGAIATGILPESEVIEFLKNKPKNLEVVLTGRDPSAAMQEICDYHTECVMIKHPYETSGLASRKGIEF
ncbi:MAG TPA: cob(I)yrinic acid a,c-diamide adenosyltransferase [Clostridiaceae bacterium]|nr:cob(I)yrinic acid a,c-diamide adenosyltransferase [Clostridiaceae bacterium]